MSFPSSKQTALFLVACGLILAALLFFLWPPKEVVPPEPVVQSLPAKEYKIGIVTDIQTTRKKSQAYGLDPVLIVDPLERFIQHSNTVFQPDVIVHIGDLIEGTNRRGEKSIEDFKAIDAYLAKTNAPRLHVMGNHERRGLSDQEWKELTGNDSTYYFYDQGDLRILVLDYDDYGKGDMLTEYAEKDEDEMNAALTYTMSEEQLFWIEKTFGQSIGRQIVVFIHVPINEELISGGYHSRVNPPEQRERLRALFSIYRVQAVLSGHVEYLFYKEEDGVRYYTLPGFFRSKNKSTAHWYGTYYDGLVSDTFSLTMYYRKEPGGPYQTVAIPSPEFEALQK